MFSHLVIITKYTPTGFSGALYNLIGIYFVLIICLHYSLFISFSKPIITCAWPSASVHLVLWYQACIRGRWTGPGGCGAVKHLSAPLIHHCREGRGTSLSSAEARESHRSCWLIVFSRLLLPFLSQRWNSVLSADKLLQRCLLEQRPHLVLVHSAIGAFSLSSRHLYLKSTADRPTLRILLF